MEFLSMMAAALSRYGETADSLETGLQACARTLGVEVAFFSVPTVVFVAYGHGAAMHTVLLHTRDSAVDLQTLSLLDETLLDVTRGRKSAAQGLAEVRLITARPLRFPWYMRVLASGVGAASMSVFLGGGVRELSAAIPVGLAVGALSVLARRMQRLTSLVELLAGFLAAVLTLALGHALPHFHLATVVLAGLILLLPGLSITLGVSELAARHLVSGSARLAGATVYVVASNGEKAARALELGAHTVIDRSRTDWVREMHKHTGGRGVDMVVDNVGAATLNSSMKAVARGGRIVIIGNTSGPQVEIDIRYIFTKQISLIGSTMGSHQDFREITALLREKRLKPVIDRTMPLSEGLEAFSMMERGDQFGKIVLIP